VGECGECAVCVCVHACVSGVLESVGVSMSVCVCVCVCVCVSAVR